MPKIAVLTNINMGLQARDKAPDFKLFNTEKKPVALNDFPGSNVVLLFFPLAFTSTCTAELCNIRDNYKIYSDLNAVVLGISVDSLFTLAKYREEQKLNFNLLSDFNKEVSARYGCLYDEFIYGMKGVSKRAAFVISKEGIIHYAEVLENSSEQPNYTSIKSHLEALNQLC